MKFAIGRDARRARREANIERAGEYLMPFIEEHRSHGCNKALSLVKRDHNAAAYVVRHPEAASQMYFKARAAEEDTGMMLWIDKVSPLAEAAVVYKDAAVEALKNPEIRDLEGTKRTVGEYAVSTIENYRKSSTRKTRFAYIEGAVISAIGCGLGIVGTFINGTNGTTLEYFSVIYGSIGVLWAAGGKVRSMARNRFERKAGPVVEEYKAAQKEKDLRKNAALN